MEDTHKLNKLAQQKKKANRMGGEEKVRRQPAKGRLTARERIQQLLEPH